ncbi:hypothetical protein KZX46_21425 (plasmid) [Polymorphobacter sp. PAMC 29334]|uniref:hypothetical protein n=1 Tax=Polymorphobacter sp. PAMC 29334 TaxID=2862331 RepID=UPI001C7442A7|nr:hypothetical protein [Polymorphobacter sp. PAMC 29334]QYE37200.1 hypothetical protein KZX46_21425 [Polymorphobacter sp. PAMC 29334]
MLFGIPAALIAFAIVLAVLDHNAPKTCETAVSVSADGTISRGPMVLGRLTKRGDIEWSHDPKVVAAEESLERVQWRLPLVGS